mmetsp:Transcript_1233/g.3785  ORF Transcript_1233/g.3785 Transcript_1233/m.3785 type:complete len:206 (+) Transcript_1233:6065-6682(+)
MCACLACCASCWSTDRPPTTACSCSSWPLSSANRTPYRRPSRCAPAPSPSSRWCPPSCTPSTGSWRSASWTWCWPTTPRTPPSRSASRRWIALRRSPTSSRSTLPTRSPGARWTRASATCACACRVSRPSTAMTLTSSSRMWFTSRPCPARPTPLLRPAPRPLRPHWPPRPPPRRRLVPRAVALVPGAPLSGARSHRPVVANAAC